MYNISNIMLLNMLVISWWVSPFRYPFSFIVFCPLYHSHFRSSLSAVCPLSVVHFSDSMYISAATFLFQ